MLIVVAAAIVRDGFVLAAQRSYPPELAGQWELPGGKVKPRETEHAALQRECAEELGITISVGDRLGVDLPTTAVEGVLRVYECLLTAGEPAAIEHRAVRWLAPGALDDLAWLETDRPLIPALRSLLARS